MKSKLKTLSENKSCFIGRVVVEMLPDGRKMKLLEEFSFIDSSGFMWTAPKGSIVNGASIPRFLWVWGSPYVGKYRRASVIHDVFCDFRIKSHQETHKMFHEAIVCDGVGNTKASLMYGALKIGAPRWS